MARLRSFGWADWVQPAAAGRAACARGRSAGAGFAGVGGYREYRVNIFLLLGEFQ